MKFESYCAVTAVLLCTSIATAQTAVDAGIKIIVTEPSLSTKLFTGCLPRADQCGGIPADCSPLNLNNCDEADDGASGRGLDFTLTFPNGPLLFDGELLVFFEVEEAGEFSDSSDCSPSDLSNVAIHDSIADPDTSGNLRYEFEFGDLLYASDLYAAGIGVAPGDVCSTPESKLVRICFALNANDDEDDRISAEEARGFIVLPVDTEPPEQVGFTAAPLEFDQALQVNVVVNPSANQNDVEFIQIHYREKPATPDGLDCRQWSDCRMEIVRVNDGNDTNTNNDRDLGNISVTINDLTNGQEYEICALAGDRAGNLSDVPSSIINGTPVEECDFFECFPGPLKTGVCGATPGSYVTLWAMLAGLLFRRRRKVWTA